MALRYWVGNGSSSNWNATAPTNWSATSGGANDASVPTSVDDVIFDGAGATGNTNSTISATITILSLNITTGYTATMTHNANLTLAGGVGSVWTYHGGYTISGTSNIIINGSLTLTSNGTTWINSVSLATGTITLVGDFTVNGSTTVTNSCTINRTTTEVYRTNGISHSSQSVSGTATIILTGGTWNSGVFGASLNNNLEFAGNVTIASIVNKAAGILKYTSGTITTTGSTFYIFGSCTLDTNGITWNNITYSNTTTTTLTSNLSIGGLLTISGTTTINRSTAETVTCAGGMTINAGLSGTAAISWTGGTWTQGATTYGIANSTTIAGNVTFSGANTSISGGTWTYSSGTVTTTGNTLNIRGNCTLNLNGISFNDMNTGTGTTVTLTSNLLLNGSLTPVNTSTINRTTTETLTCNGLGFNTSNRVLVGTAKIILIGGTWAGNTTYSSNIRIENDLEINGNVTISSGVTKAGGTLTYVSGVVTTTGSTLFTRFATTLNTNGITWNNITTSADGLGQTITLTSNISIAGLLNIGAGGTTTINRTTAETVTCAGGMTLNAGLSGTAKIILTGGTWSGNNRVSNDVDVNGNITISGSVKFGGLNFNYISGSVTTTSSTFNIDTASSGLTINFNSSAITWNNFGIETALNQTIFVLTSDLTINGLFTANSFTGSINKTTNQIIYANGGYFQNSYVMGGSADIYLQGGTITGQLRLNTYINGNVTFATCSLVSNTKTYLSGTISQTGVVSVGSVTLDMKEGVFPRNVSTIVDTFGTYGITLLSDLNVLGTLIFADSSSSFNTSNASRINVYGGLTHFKSNGGSAPVYLKGGTWSTTATNNMTCNVFIDGNITISGNIYYGTSAITYLSGNVKSVNAILNLTSSCSLLNMNKVKLNAAIVTAGQTITMNQPFVGTEEQICQVSSTGANYTITFTDTFEKIARNVAISGATLSRPMQMIVATNPKFSTNRGTNVGMRYNNQSPNGFAKNVFPISDDTLTGVAGGLVSDPCFVRQG